VEAAVKALGGRYSHQFTYDRRDIVRLCRDSGFQLRHVRRYGILPRNSMSRLPGALRRSHAFAAVYSLADAVASTLLNPFCQNYEFVAVTEAQPRAGAPPTAPS
jgi:hypothetical protein